VIAAAFAVAFAVLISSAEAVVYSNIPTDTSAGTVIDAANNGDTVYIKNTEGTAYVRFEIESTGSAAAQFTHDDAADGGQSILCREAADGAKAKCDADTRVSGGDGVTVALKIDDDSGKGVIFVKQTTVPAEGAETVTTDTITVSVAQVPANIAVTASPKSIAEKDEPTTLSIRLTDTDGKGIAGEGLTVIASHGTLTEATEAPAAWALRDVEDTTTVADGEYDGLSYTGGGTQVATLITSSDAGDAAADGAGFAAVTLTGGGAPGTATVTVRMTIGTVDGSVDVILFGAAKTITAVAEQSAIAIGESTFIVVTVTDAGTNPVAGATASVKDTGGLEAPSKLDTPVAQSRSVNKDGREKGTIQKGDIPACDATVTQVTVDEQTDGDPPLRFASTGTNRDGQCVIQITATDDTSSLDNDTARGEHTITIVGSADRSDPKAIDAVEVVIQVGGAPASIESDAPERIDPSAELTVNITVVDDEDVRVGKVAIEVIQTAGDGKIITEAKANTSDGRAKFTYLAPSTPGVTEFLVRTKAPGTGAVTAKLPIIIDIGEEPVEVVVPPPAAPSLSVQPASTGFSLVTFSGGSIGELATAVEDACGAGGRVYATDYLGRWVSYIPAAMMGPVNAAFEQLFPDGVPAGEPLLVGGCSG
jgi:hypothetical protein